MLKEFFIIKMVEKSAEKLITHVAETSFNKHNSNNNSRDSQNAVTHNTYNTEIYNDNSDAESKTISLVCEKCKGTMTVDKDRSVLRCPYCGSAELIPENDNVKIAKIKNDTQKEIELKKLEFQERERQRKYEAKEKDRRDGNIVLIVIACFIVLSFLALCVMVKMEESDKQPIDPNLAVIEMSSSDYCENNYQFVKNSLSKSGFTNITLEPVYDIYFGVLSSEGEVAKVTINGIAKFEKYETFPKDAEIIITYHLNHKEKQTVE